MSRPDLWSLMERSADVSFALSDRHGEYITELLDEYHTRFPPEEDGDDNDEDDDDEGEDEDEEYLPRPRVK